MRDENRDQIISAGANLSGALVGAAAKLVLPENIVLDAVIAPIFTSVSQGLVNRIVSQNEKTRISIVYEQAAFKIQQKLNNNEIPRDDDYYAEDEFQQSSASKILEGTLLKCKDEIEAKKMSGYSSFLANISFDHNLSYEEGNAMMVKYASLSIQQICILKYLNEGNIIPLGKWEKYMLKYDELKHYFTFYSDCLSLYNDRLAGQPEAKKGTIQLGTPEICFSQLGRMMCSYFNQGLSEKEKILIETKINTIQAIVDRLKQAEAANS